MTRRERRALEREQKKSRVSPRTKLSYWYRLVPCLAAFLIYARSLSFGFVCDDWLQIVINPQIKSWHFLPELLTTHLWSQFDDTPAPSLVRYYRPVFSVWLLLVHTLGGVAPFAWHLATVMLHVAVTYLVFKIALELLERPIAASAAACLFAIHPIHLEDVCWISAANELIYAGFALCSLLFLFYGNRRARPAYIWLSL